MNKLSFDIFIAEAMPTDTGNPTGTGAVSPAQRAQQLGLQSDGHGSYLDPQTGEVRARTVNGELIFYDQSRASGGAIADGSGGAQLTQSAPSWIDPDTGNIVVPPARPESQAEIEAVPSPTPSTSPIGFDDFMLNKKKEGAAKNKMQSEIQGEIDQKMQEITQNPEIAQQYQNLMDQLNQSTEPEEQEEIILALQYIEIKYANAEI